MFEYFWSDEDGVLAFELFDGKVFAHAKAHNWSKEVYLKFQDIWHVAKEELNNSGHKEVYVIIPADDKKLIKFETMFGFKPLEQRENMLLMVCSTEVNHGD